MDTIKSADYTPRDEDIDFAEMLIKMVKRGGAWCVPATGDTYRLDHDNKQLVLVDGDPKSQLAGLNACVFEKLGWTTVDGTGEE